DFLSKLWIRVDERVKTLLQNLLRRSRHNRQIDEALQLRLLDQFESPLADVDSNITDTLKILDNFESGGDESQITGYRLFERENLIAEVIDLDFEFVQFIVPPDDFFSQCRPAIDESPNGIRNHDLG